MRIGEYVDGRDLTYDHQTAQFAIGGTPVSLVQVLQYDAHSQIQWSNAETHGWAMELRNWMESSDADPSTPGGETCDVAPAAPAPPPSAIPPVALVQAASPTTDASPARSASSDSIASPEPASPAAKKKMSPETARLLWGSLATLVVFLGVSAYTGVWGCGIASVILIVAVILSAKKESRRQSSDATMTCPHCLTKGSVRTKSITQKKGISGGKATAAILTGGVSMLATGLSRKEPGTEAHCSHCGATWRF